jgi:hypothetical protein
VEIARGKPKFFHANYAKGFASGHYPAADKRRLTMHVEVHGYFAWDVGSTPTASTIFNPSLDAVSMLIGGMSLRRGDVAIVTGGANSRGDYRFGITAFPTLRVARKYPIDFSSSSVTSQTASE